MFYLEEKIFNHSIILQDRKELSLTGVKDCLNFDEETISLETNLGKLTIKGSGLHIQNFNTDNGELSCEGKIHALVYTYDEKQNGFFSKIFR